MKFSAITFLLGVSSAVAFGDMDNVLGCMIPIFHNNANIQGAGNDQGIGTFDSAASCVQAVKDDCPWANIANMGVSDEGGSVGCWCQYGDDYTDNASGSFKNCLLGPIEDFAGPASS